jgi:hypothetical protein
MRPFAWIVNERRKNGMIMKKYQNRPSGSA